jgi:hypothetical protein
MPLAFAHSGELMRTYAMIAASTVALAVPLATPTAQAPESRRDSLRREYALPRSVALEAASLYNQPAALRASGSLEIPVEQVVNGDVAVLNGPLTVAGRVRGRVVVINGDAILLATARIEGDLFVVGGVVEGQDRAYIGGEIQVYRQVLRYREEGDVIVAETDRPHRAEPDDDDEDRWVRRWRRRHVASSSKISIGTSGNYNRVEGLPIFAGPKIRGTTSWGGIQLDAFGIIRSADHFNWSGDNLGHDVRAEIRLGRDAGIAVGGRLFDVVDAVERWHLQDTEVGLASFFLHRDYRDYFDRHGGTVYASIFAERAFELTVGLSDQRWGSRSARDPWTLFRANQVWRPNPLMDQGDYRVATARLTIDTRNDEDDPWSGWYIVGDLERGASDNAVLAPTSELARPLGTPGEPQTLAYTRGFLDLRRYNRVSPEGQLNFRVVVGGWLEGDELPLQRRLSIGGVGTLAGFDFRKPSGATDYFTCASVASEAVSLPAGSPAQCERVAMAQLEYRGDLHIDIGGDDDDDRDWRFGYEHRGNWVVFADAGRGWLVGPQQVADLQYRAREFPELSTFRTDVGVGVDVGLVGLYVAKSISDPGEPANFLVRLRHRF